MIRLSSIGDIVHALPAVAALGQSFPKAEIHWVIENRYASLLAGNPYVHRIIPLDTLSWRGSLPPASIVKETVKTFMGIRRVAYEAVVDFQGLWKSAMIALLSGVKERVGLAEHWLRRTERGGSLHRTGFSGGTATRGRREPRPGRISGGARSAPGSSPCRTLPRPTSMLTANSLASRRGTSCSLILEGAGRLSAGRPRTTHCFSAISSRGLPARFCSPGRQAKTN